jgi:hypothetical protein
MILKYVRVDRRYRCNLGRVQESYGAPTPMLERAGPFALAVNCNRREAPTSQRRGLPAIRAVKS